MAAAFAWYDCNAGDFSHNPMSCAVHDDDDIAVNDNLVCTAHVPASAQFSLFVM